MRKLLSIILIVSIWGIVSSNAYAGRSNEIEEDIEVLRATCTLQSSNASNYIVTNGGKVLYVDDLLEFSSKEEAHAYVDGVLKSLKSKEYTSKERAIKYANYAADSAGTSGVENFRGECTVAKQQVSFGASINLVATYTLTTPNRSGRVESCDCYTSFTGFTYSFEWNETYKDAWIISSGREVAATASGELIFYFLIDGLIEMWREPISLSGTCNPVH